MLRRIGTSGAELAPVVEPLTYDASSTAMSGVPIAESPSRSRASDSLAVATCENASQSLSAAPRIPMTSTQQDGPSSAPLAPLAEPRPRIAPLSAERYGLQVTISKNAHDLLRRAQDLLAHTMPSGDVGTVLERGPTELVAKLEQSKFAQTDRPVRRRSSGEGRSIPAEIKRQVHSRDGGRCPFESDDGRCCGSRRRLE